MSSFLAPINIFLPRTFFEVIEWLVFGLAFVVSLLTLYDAAKLRTGLLAVAAYSFGAGMLSLAGSFLLNVLSTKVGIGDVNLVSQILFLLGFLFLGFGSYKIYTMSKI